MVATELEERILSRACSSCGNTFDSKQVYRAGALVVNQAYCDPCIRAIIKSESRPAGTVDTWGLICPPLYQDTDLARLRVDPASIERVLGWEYGPRGIALTGETGSGKTRLMFLLLRKLHETMRVRAITAKQFERWCHRSFEKDGDARKQIAECHSAKVLFIDDIGKEKYTERVESEFYDLVEHRTSHLSPILWTANATGQELEQMMGEDRGVPVVRRLREFTEIISV